MARRALTFVTLALGVVMLGFGLFALVNTAGAPAPNLPGSPAFALRDQAVTAMMGGGLLILGALRLAAKRPRDE